MDELQFRRHAYANPFSKDEDFLKTINDNKEMADFINSLQKLDSKIEQAINIEPPIGLADKILLNHRLTTHQQKQKKRYAFFSMAASIAIVAGLYLTHLRFGPIELSENSLAHVHHEENAFIANNNIQYQQINAQLSSINSLKSNDFIEQPGEILYSTECVFRGVKSLHLVMQSKEGKVTVFIVPKEKRIKTQSEFKDQHFLGETLSKNNAYLVFVGETKEDINHIKNNVQRTFI